MVHIYAHKLSTQTHKMNLFLKRKEKIRYLIFWLRTCSLPVLWLLQVFKLNIRAFVSVLGSGVLDAVVYILQRLSWNCSHFSKLLWWWWSLQEAAINAHYTWSLRTRSPFLSFSVLVWMGKSKHQEPPVFCLCAGVNWRLQSNFFWGVHFQGKQGKICCSEQFSSAPYFFCPDLVALTPGFTV